MLTAPCKDCPFRHERCHSRCEKYLAFKAEREQYLADKNKNAAFEDYLRTRRKK